MVCTRWKLSNENLAEEIEPVVMERFFQVNSTFFSKKSHSFFIEATKQFFLWNTLVQVENLRLRPRWKNWILRYWRKVTSNIEEVQNWLRFLAFPQCADHRMIYFSRNFSKLFVFSSPADTRLVESVIPQNCKEVKFFRIEVEFLNRL